MNGIQHTGIGLGTNFHRRQTVLILTRFAQKGYFRSEIGQLNLTIDFSEFELVLMKVSS